MKNSIGKAGRIDHSRHRKRKGEGMKSMRQLLFMLIWINRKKLAEKGRSWNEIIFNVSLTVCFNILNVITIVDHDSTRIL